MDKRTFKNNIYRSLSRVIKAMANPHRMEVIDLLAQGAFTVEQIAHETAMSVANASQHLQVLKKAQLVTTTRSGNFIRYQLSSPQVYTAWKALRDLGFAQDADVSQLLQDFRKDHGSLASLDLATLRQKMAQGDVILLDVRPEDEYQQGHIPGAISLPVDQLEERLAELPRDQRIVAYCRGPLCVFADEAVQRLQLNGYEAVRLEAGVADWHLAESSPNPNEQL